MNEGTVKFKLPVIAPTIKKVKVQKNWLKYLYYAFKFDLLLSRNWNYVCFFEIIFKRTIMRRFFWLSIQQRHETGNMRHILIIKTNLAGNIFARQSEALLCMRTWREITYCNNKLAFGEVYSRGNLKCLNLSLCLRETFTWSSIVPIQLSPTENKISRMILAVRTNGGMNPNGS